MPETDVLVIGAGQCGLAFSRELSLRGISHEVLSETAAPGDVWRDRWDTLRLFTPARFDALPGMRFPADGRACPSAGEFADYLDAYAERFAVPLQLRRRVTGVMADDKGSS